METTYENVNCNAINSDFSKRITALRFILAVFVVFIHAVPDNIHFSDGITNCLDDAPIWIKAIVIFFSRFLGQIAVPMFFIISGYLFFAKPKPFAITIKTKCKTIALPYFLWNVIAIILTFLVQYASNTESYFHQNPIREWPCQDWILAFWSNNTLDNLAGPIVAQFWYIRDLLCLMIISPIIKTIAEKFSCSYLIVVSLLYVLHIAEIVPDYLGFVGALFYFSIGYYAVIYIETIMKMVDAIKKSDFIFSFIVFLGVDMYFLTTQQLNFGFINLLSLWFTMLFFLKLAGIVIKYENIYSKLKGLAVFSFWIYAAHKPFVISVIKRLHVKFLPMDGPWILLQFFGDTLVCVGLLVLIAIALKKWFSKIFALLTGSR